MEVELKIFATTIITPFSYKGAAFYQKNHEILELLYSAGRRNAKK